MCDYCNILSLKVKYLKVFVTTKLSIKILGDLYSIMTALCLYILTSSSVNTQRMYVTSHKVPNLSGAIIQVKKSDHLDIGFKEITYHPSAIARSDLDKYHKIKR